MTLHSPALLGDPASSPAPPRHRWLPGWPATPGRVALLAGANLAALAFFLLSYSGHGVGFGRYRIDLDVYRIGGQAWLHGRDLYGTLPATASGARLPFSYPPFAAIVLSPLSLVPMALAGTLLTLATVALTAVTVRAFLRAAGHTGSWWTVGWLLPAALLLEPVRNTLNYGQVNVALMALVTADCLTTRPRWPRGALVGVAAAVKLTPGAFVLYFLLRRDYRAVLTTASSFAACAAVGFLLAPHDSARFWTSVISQASRPGNPDYAANQAITGVLARAGLAPHTPVGLTAWLLLSAVVLAMACRGMRHALDEAADAWALSLNALAGLLISPISWSHHWVWGETAMLTLILLAARHQRPAGLVLAGYGLALFAAAPQWWFPTGGNRELHWAAWQQVIGSSYVLLAAVLLLLAAVGRLSTGAPGPLAGCHRHIRDISWKCSR